MNVPCAVFAWSALVVAAVAQAPGVPIYEEPPPDVDSAETVSLVAQATKLREAGQLLPLAAVQRQLDPRSCALVLPPPGGKPLDGVEVWRAARAAYLRIGWLHRCTECEQWHLDLSGGYAIAAGGVVATCQHVLVPVDGEMLEPHLVAADDHGTVFAVHEVLASDAATDVAILRTGAKDLVPLPLRVAAQPGEPAFVFSDPGPLRGHFSAGIVNGFVREPVGSGDATRVVVHVSTAWAPGSSGAAVLDAAGNAIGHVATIETVLDEPEPLEAPAADGKPAAAPPPVGTFMVVRRATRAHDVLALVRPPAAGEGR
jgi:hypothetical protein